MKVNGSETERFENGRLLQNWTVIWRKVGVHFKPDMDHMIWAILQQNMKFCAMKNFGG